MEQVVVKPVRFNRKTEKVVVDKNLNVEVLGRHDTKLDNLPSSRKEAQETGARYYFTGRPCKNGHLSKRRTDVMHCVTCENERQKATYKRRFKNKYRKDNREENPTSTISRPDARRAGLRYYYTGELCARGHKSQRYTASGRCFVCEREDKERRQSMTVVRDGNRVIVNVED